MNMLARVYGQSWWSYNDSTNLQWHDCGLCSDIDYPLLIQDLYEQVKKEEFKVPDGEGGLAETFFNPEREGWLTKEGGRYKSKHKRWFILKEGMLYYFKQANVSCASILIPPDTAQLPWCLVTYSLIAKLEQHQRDLSMFQRLALCHLYTTFPLGWWSDWQYSPGASPQGQTGDRPQVCSKLFRDLLWWWSD